MQYMYIYIHTHIHTQIDTHTVLFNNYTCVYTHTKQVYKLIIFYKRYA